MKIVQINEFCGKGSTGQITLSISHSLMQRNIENYIFYTSGVSEEVQSTRYMSRPELKFQALKSKIFGNFGFNSGAATRRLIKLLSDIKPDIVHLHNLHGHNCHFDLLLTYLSSNHIKTYWTFHDCWAYTAYCPHYDMISCEKWKSGCTNCPLRKKYSWFFDRSEYLYSKKKKAFRNLDLTIVTPSQWLADQVKQSFLKNYPVKVIHNGVNLSIFKPTSGEFLQRYGLENKYIVLGVSNIWVYQKGTDVFIELSKRLDDRFRIVMVGTDESIDTMLPDNIVSIHRTANQVELAQIYTAANVFVNPTRQEVLGLTNIEAIACGTPVVMFRTGGSPECIDDTCGVCVEKDDIAALVGEITKICLSSNQTHKQAYDYAKKFDSNTIYNQYCDLYTTESIQE